MSQSYHGAPFQSGPTFHFHRGSNVRIYNGCIDQANAQGNVYGYCQSNSVSASPGNNSPENVQDNSRAGQGYSTVSHPRNFPSRTRFKDQDVEGMQGSDYAFQGHTQSSRHEGLPQSASGSRDHPPENHVGESSIPLVRHPSIFGPRRVADRAKDLDQDTSHIFSDSDCSLSTVYYSCEQCGGCSECTVDDDPPTAVDEGPIPPIFNIRPFLCRIFKLGSSNVKLNEGTHG